MAYRWWMIPLSMILTAGLSVPAFAQSPTPTLPTQQNRQHEDSHQALVIDYVNASPSGHGPGSQQTWQWTIKISNVKVPENTGSSFLKFRVLSPSQQQNFVNNDDIGSPLSIYPIESTQVLNGTITATFQSSAPKLGNNLIDVSEYFNRSGEGTGSSVEVRQESPAVSITSLPYGQLPEVPLASVLPAMLIVGFGLWMYKHRPTVSPLS
ncbi:hypothetical protein [Sulfobacillus thermosulfidooxidans]|uniref:hypothetical protein n=1 Tax=Sulfobacillus thermosulfidooxidans TaxID=28034 RepID=UPI00096B9326|nr:hypothetical protein [Sulfobacillus thermosulfidooxidans]OLZ11972.1 hypothetical protein BFX05_05715 [Sulfobacillus thermosulfidooxidans]OLZ17655.1 hypothetical protein BFX06_12960 [Sulfobacillus thermosulfidooxidans]OLZ22436.1 hypothetical protein BFX07_00330 [Sulfobacillus thermosulfidooxidans]